MFNRIWPRGLVSAACILYFAVLPPDAKAEFSALHRPLDAVVAGTLTRAAQASEQNAFEGAVRQALKSHPEQKQAILRLAVDLRPDWAMGLIAEALSESAPVMANPVTTVADAVVVPSKPPKAPPKADVKTAPPAKPKPAFSGSFDFGGILRTGNTENGGIKGQLKLGYKSDRWKHKGTAEAGYLKSRTDTLEQKFELEYESNYDIRDNLFAFGLANYTDDRFSGFDYEILTAAGLGVRLFDEDPLKWEVTAGPSLRYAEISDSDERETSPGARFTNDITWQISDSAFIGNETEVLWDSERITVDNDTSLKMRIVDQLSGKLSFNTRYRSNLPEDTENTDTTTRASIVYDF